MDPVTVVSLAASILTFVDFSHKLITGTLDVIESGKTSGTGHTKAIIDDLQDLTEALETEFLEQSVHQIALRDLAAKCKDLSKTLQDILKKLVAKSDSKREAITVALRSMYKKGEVASLVAQISQYRSEIIARLILILNERQITISVQVASLGDHISANYSALVDKLRELQNDILNSVKKGLDDLTTEAQADSRKIDELQAVLGIILDLSLPPTPETRILRQLYYPAMYTREDSVRNAAYGTFNWILRDGNHDSGDNGDASNYSSEDTRNDQILFHKEIQKSRDHQSQARRTFLQWLSNENGVFHIMGKAGSGKSTLMKLIAEHQRTKEALKTWAGEKQLVFTQFFAWRAGGDDKQKTLHGLYQSILFSTLLHHQSLIPIVFPEATRAFSFSKYDSHIDEPYFRLPKLHKAFQTLAKDCPSSGYRFCFLIDGLDEFMNDLAQGHTYQELAGELISWAEHDHIKILVSSRPEPDLTEMVQKERQIHLQDLTKPDILKLAKAIFRKHESIKVVKLYYLDLIQQVVVDAKGVFTWVLFMIIELCRMAKAGEDFRALKKFLNQGHSLDELYQKLLSSINPAHRDMVFKMLFIVTQCSSGLPILALTWIDEIFNPEFPATSKIEAYSRTELERRQRVAESRVAETKGLLEINISPRRRRRPFRDHQHTHTSLDFEVEFFHRTAYDFFRQSQQMRDLSAAYPDLKDCVIEAKIQLACLWFLDKILLENYRFMLNLGNYVPSSSEDEDWRGLTELKHRFLDTIEIAANHHNSRGSPFLFHGAEVSPYPLGMTKNLWQYKYSHLHYIAASSVDLEYIQGKLKEAPEAMHGDGELSLLFSAAFRKKSVELITYLLEEGVSPNEHIRLHGRDGETSACIWVLICAFLTSRMLSEDDSEVVNKFLNMLKAFLVTKKVDPNVSIVLLERYYAYDYESDYEYESNKITYEISLKHFVQQLQPDKHDIWEELFSDSERRRAGNRGVQWLFSAPRNFGAFFHSTISYLLRGRILQSVWGYVFAQGFGKCIHDFWVRSIRWELEPMSLPLEEHKPFKIGMKPELPPDGDDEHEYGFYVHSIVLDGAATLISDMNVRVY